MKIDGHHHSAEADRARRGESASAPGRTGGAGTTRTTPGTDRVETSADLKLAAAAMQAILDAPSIRPEAVERGRQALQNGTLGADAPRLADCIITRLADQ
jgi:anti-sigma28 factor (negative regulator of flagellin synthesis)